jgi:hypothetical protein
MPFYLIGNIGRYSISHFQTHIILLVLSM